MRPSRQEWRESEAEFPNDSELVDTNEKDTNLKLWCEQLQQWPCFILPTVGDFFG